MPPVVLSKVERYVDPGVRKRGQDYARLGAVVMHKRDSTGEPVRALVRGGGGSYHVTLLYENGALHVDCTCPYLNGELEPCKHIWATLIRCATNGIEFPGPSGIAF